MNIEYRFISCRLLPISPWLLRAEDFQIVNAIVSALSAASMAGMLYRSYTFSFKAGLIKIYHPGKSLNLYDSWLNECVLNLSIRNITDSMLKGKRTASKQIPKPKKKMQTVNPITCNTEEIRISTICSMDLKSFNKTIQIKKLPSHYPKKSISRKSTNQSTKTTTALQSPKFARLLKDFKDLKLIHQNSSKSHTPRKSVSNKKIKPKKLSYQTLRNNTLNSKSLSSKLQKTLKKLQVTDLFRADMSELPIASTSDASIQLQSVHIPEIDDEDVIDIDQLRNFCSIVPGQKEPSQVMKYNKSFKENQAASKIQRAWKRFRTRRLIEQYTYLLKSQFSESIYSQDYREDSNSLEKMNKAVNIFYKEDGSEQISNVKQVSQISVKQSSKEKDYDHKIESIKEEQLNKWDEIIRIIKESKRSNPLDIQRLFATIAYKSEINKKQLEGISDINFNHPSQRAQKRQSLLLEDIKIPLNTSKEPNSLTFEDEKKMYGYANMRNIAQLQSKSQNSIEEGDEYNCRKYVSYLDCDTFVFGKDNHQESHQKIKEVLQKTTISKIKQQILLNNLNQSKLPTKRRYLSSNSLQSYDVFEDLNIKQSGENILSNVKSQRILHRLIKSNAEQMYSQEVLEEMPSEYLRQQNPISMQDFEQGRHLATDQSNSNNSSIEQNEISQDPKKNQLTFNEQEDYHCFQRSKPSFKFYQELNEEKDLTFFKIHTVEHEGNQQEIEESNISSEQISAIEKEHAEFMEKQRKIQEMSILVFNIVILQTLKDFARSDLLAESFKAYAKAVRSSVEQKESNQKRGFPTDQKQVQFFLENIIKYLKAQQPRIFYNLQVPTGPSASQLLKYMHQSSNQEQSSDSEADNEANIMVIPNRIFDTFWKLKQQSIINNPGYFHHSDIQLFHNNIDYLKNINKIYYRSLFDSFNQSLDKSRNFGQYGQPFPWKKASSFVHKYTEQKIQAQIKAAKNRMIEVATTYCGLIIEKEQLDETKDNDQQCIVKIQEDRLSRLLASDLIEQQSRWIFYDDEETEILVELSKWISRLLFDEIIGEIGKIRNIEQ